MICIGFMINKHTYTHKCVHTHTTRTRTHMLAISMRSRSYNSGLRYIYIHALTSVCTHAQHIYIHIHTHDLCASRWYISGLRYIYIHALTSVAHTYTYTRKICTQNSYSLLYFGVTVHTHPCTYGCMHTQAQIHIHTYSRFLCKSPTRWYILGVILLASAKVGSISRTVWACMCVCMYACVRVCMCMYSLIYFGSYTFSFC
jgi:hypothetical protein